MQNLERLLCLALASTVFSCDGGRSPGVADRKLFTHRERAREPWHLYPGAARTQRFNLVNGTQLYEITVDPGEQNDVGSGVKGGEKLGQRGGGKIDHSR